MNLPKSTQKVTSLGTITPTLDGTGKLISLTTSPWTNNLTFPSLSPGTYTFTIAATNSSGTGSATQTIVTLT